MAAYYWACVRFFDWCDERRIGQFADIESLHVDEAESRRDPHAVRLTGPGQIVATDRAHAVRGPSAQQTTRT
jgi:hypothetical protein